MANVAAEERGKTRAKLTQAATTLFYTQGTGNTTLADVAEASGVPLGNIYYHFKTKDDLTQAVVERRTEALETDLANAEREAKPLDKLLTLLQESRAQSELLSQYGCPYASLISDLDKLETDQDAAHLFRLSLDYAERQFAALGLDRPVELAAELLSRLQGAYLLAHALKSPALLKTQLDRLETWLKSLT